jgi:serine protease Do
MLYCVNFFTDADNAGVSMKTALISFISYTVIVSTCMTYAQTAAPQQPTPAPTPKKAEATKAANDKKAAPAAAQKQTAQKNTAQKAAAAKPAVLRSDDIDGKLAAVADKVVPSVVSVRVVRSLQDNNFSSENNPSFPFNAPAQRPVTILSGSGIILDARGNIATNYHVVQSAESIYIQLNDLREYSCDLVGADPVTDIAVIHISLNVPPDLVPAQFADSSKVRTGQLALAVGNSYGFQNTVSMGIISASGRPGNSFAEAGDFLQTDAALNPGNSGGALADSTGKIVGMNTAVYSRSGGTTGLGFSIPSNTIKDISAKILSQGMVFRGWSGLLIQDLNPDRAQKLGLPQRGGAVVTDTMKGSPAAASGVMTGDVIVAADGKAVGSARSLHEKIVEKKPGDKIILTVLRDGKKIDLSVFMGNYPGAERGDAGSVGRPLGLGVSDVDEEEALRFGIVDKNGVVVVRIDTGRAAEASGIQLGDLVSEVDGRPVPTLEEFSRVMSEFGTKRSLVFMLKRHGAQKYVTVYLR